jgi:hypothetical protein
MSGQQHAVGTALGAVGPEALIAAPQAKSKIVVTGISIGVGAVATKVTLSFSAANVKAFDLPVNGNIPPGVMRWEGDEGAALSITTSAAGPTDIEVDYNVEAGEQ